MFKEYSKSGIGMYSTLILTAANLLGLDITQGEADNIVLTFLNLASLALWVWGQLDRRDLTFGLSRR